MSQQTTEKIFHIPTGLHADTARLIAGFAEALAYKLAAAQEKYGYTNNWMRPDWMNICRAHLLQHLEKGDPRDVAAYCAFLWHHGESTIAPQAEPVNQQLLDVARAILADDLLPLLPMEYVTKVRAAIAAAEEAQPATEPVNWSAPKTVKHLIQQLQTVEPEMPVHGAIFVEVDGKRVPRIRPLSLSRERVDGQWIKQGDESIPYQLVAWTAEQPASAQQQGEPMALIVSDADGEVAFNDVEWLIPLDSLPSGSHLYTTPPATACSVPRGWRDIESAPKDGRTILLGYFNVLGNWRTLRGQWFTKEHIDAEWEDADTFDAGWYETSVEADDVPSCWATNPTHWMPTPAAPKTRHSAQ